MLFSICFSHAHIFTVKHLYSSGWYVKSRNRFAYVIFYFPNFLCWFVNYMKLNKFCTTMLQFVSLLCFLALLCYAQWILLQVLKGLSYLREKHRIMHRGKSNFIFFKRNIIYRGQCDLILKITLLCTEVSVTLF